jgi:transposase
MAQQGLAGSEKKARREGRLIVCVDEAGFYLLPGVVRTYAPVGETPVLTVFQTRDHLSVMSGVTPEGQLATLTRRQALSGCESTRFLRHLAHCFSRRLLVIWDGSMIHRSNEVKDFLAAGGAPQIHLERFPAYAPELNPDEGVWQHLKHVELRNVCCADLAHLEFELNLAFRRIRRKPELIQSFFAQAGLPL